MNTDQIDILKQLRKFQQAQNDYLNSVPRDLQTVLFDNAYSALSDSMISMLVKSVFTSFTDDVNWFLYEFDVVKNSSVHIVDNGVEYTFKSDDDFYEYLKLQ